MDAEERKLLEAELNSPGGAGFYAPHKLPVGQSEEITVLSHMKWTQTKYPIKDKDGKDLGYTWRFRLLDGKVWDVKNINRKTLLKGLHPTSPDQTVPGRFKITNIGQVINRQPSVKVEYLGQADSISEGGTF